MPHPPARPVSGFVIGLALLAGSALAGSPAAVDSATDERETAALGEQSPALMALPLGEAPGATWVISQEEIARSGAANIFELLRRVPGVDIRYTPMGGHIGIRSTGTSPFSEEVLLLIDGTPYNSPDKGGFPGHPNYRGFFPLDRIERIEIIRGAISVLYGANAFGGVINIVSKRAGDALAGQVEGTAYGATLLTGQRDTFDRRLRGALVKNGWDVSFEAGGQDSDTPVHLNGNAANRRAELYASVSRGRFSASALHYESANLPFDFMGTRTRTARHSVDILDAHYTRRAGGFTLRASGSVNQYRGTTCAVCHNNQTLEPDNLLTGEVGDERETDQRIRAALRADRTLTDRQDLTMGIEANEDYIRRDIVRQDGAPTSLTGGGIYVQHQWHLKDRSLHILTGLRHDELEGVDGATSPRLALVAEPTENLALRASWSRAWRAPTWNERFIHQRVLPEEISPGTILVAYGTDDLSRERNDSAEAGVSWRAHPRAVLRLDLYYNRISDFIQRDRLGLFPGAPSEVRLAYLNRADEFAIRGGEISLLARPLDTLSVTAGYAYRDLTIPADDPHAAYAPRSRALLTASWRPLPSLDADVSGSYASSYTVSNPANFGLRPQPAYQLWDAAVRYRIPSQRGQLSVGLIGRNLFDKQPMESLNNPAIDTSLRGRVVAIEFRVDF